MRLDDLANDFETVSVNYANIFSIERTDDWFLLKLVEEVGELTQSYLKLTGQARAGGADTGALRENFEDEISDVLGQTLLLAKRHNVDLTAAIKRKWLKWLPENEA